MWRLRRVPAECLAETGVGKLPLGIAIAPDGKTAYVVNFSDNTITPISFPAGTPGTPIRVGNGRTRSRSRLNPCRADIPICWRLWR